MNDIEFFKKIYADLNKEDKARLAQAVENFKFLQSQTQLLQELADESPLQEAPTSATVKIVNAKSQMEWLFTVRGHNPLALLDRIEIIESELAKRDYIALDAYIDQRRASRGEQPIPRQQAGNGNGNGGQLTFQAQTLVGSVNEGKVYWKVKGAQFTKFGVAVWPEVLEAAGFLELDPLETYDLSGFIATYVKKDDGKIDKVISLVKQ